MSIFYLTLSIVHQSVFTANSLPHAVVMSASLFLRRVAAAQRGRNSVVAFAPSGGIFVSPHGISGRRAMTTTVITPTTIPESVLSGEDKTVNRFARTESIVS